METEEITLPSGKLTAAELLAIINALPVDITFVDSEDRVKFFSESKERIFSRPRSVIGRKVQNCHPPRSLDIVEKIISDFRAGNQDRASFWIEMEGRFIHIEYIAVRNGQGEYLGTLEVSQDLTEKRKLQGERRLLNY